jgi:hypothetical protein
MIKFVFLKQLTASWEMLSMLMSSADLSAKNRSGLHDLPSGGALLLRAVILLSNSPVILGSTGNVSRFFISIVAEILSSEYCFQIL